MCRQVGGMNYVIEKEAGEQSGVDLRQTRRVSETLRVFYHILNNSLFVKRSDPRFALAQLAQNLVGMLSETRRVPPVGNLQ